MAAQSYHMAVEREGSEPDALAMFEGACLAAILVVVPIGEIMTRSEVRSMYEIRMPHPLALLFGCILVAAALTHLIPSGRLARRVVRMNSEDREVVVAGTYQRVGSQAIGVFEAIVAIPKGFVAAAEVIGLVFLVGASFIVLESTGSLDLGASWLLSRFGRKAPR